MLDAGLALGADGGHEQVFRARDRRHVEVHDPAPEPPGLGRPRLHVALFQRTGDAQTLEALQVVVDGPGPDGAAAGQRNPGAAQAGEQRPQHQHRGPHGLDQIVGRFRAGDGVGVHPHRVALPLPARAQAFQNAQHGAGVAQVGDVVQHVLARREQGRGQKRQGRVLGPADAHLAVERPSAFNHQCIHTKRPRYAMKRQASTGLST